MKKYFKTLLFLSLSSTLFVACSKEEEKGPTGPVYTSLVSSEVIILGGQTNSSYGSFYSISEDSVYLKANADLFPAKIDLIYYFGLNSGDSSVITSPNDGVFNLPSDQTPFPSVKSWATKNNTTFLALDINYLEFNALTNDSLFINDLDSNVTATKITKLMVGDVVGFKTASGKFGAYCVKAINNTNALTRAITIDIKVQE